MVHGLAEAGHLDLFFREGKIVPDDNLLSILHVIATLMSPIDHISPRVEVHVLNPVQLADLAFIRFDFHVDAYTCEH